MEDCTKLLLAFHIHFLFLQSFFFLYSEAFFFFGKDRPNVTTLLQTFQSLHCCKENVQNPDYDEVIDELILAYHTGHSAPSYQFPTILAFHLFLQHTEFFTQSVICTISSA